MADITKLQKPEAGQSVTITTVKGTNLELDFDPAGAIMTREGDNLVFTFEDGSKVELAAFYTNHYQEGLPEFTIQGAVISGKDFFAALSDELQPAAGPDQANKGGRFYDTGTAELMDGISALDGVDMQGADAMGELGADALGGLGADALAAGTGFWAAAPTAGPDAGDSGAGDSGAGGDAGTQPPTRTPAVDDISLSDTGKMFTAEQMQANPTVDVTLTLSDTTRAGDILTITINGVTTSYTVTDADIATHKVVLPDVNLSDMGKVDVSVTASSPEGAQSPEIADSESWKFLLQDAQLAEHDAAAGYVTVTLGKNFSAADTVSLSDPRLGTLEIDADGNLIFVPNADFINKLAPGQDLQVELQVNGNATGAGLVFTGNGNNVDVITIDALNGGQDANAHNHLTGDDYTFRGSKLDAGAGNDTVTIGSISNGGMVGGGAGSDSITIGGAVSGGFIGGDAGLDMTNSTGGDRDSIHIAGTVSGNTYIGGDAGNYMANSTGGANDSIDIMGNVSAANIGGDVGGSMAAKSKGGDADSIHIMGNVSAANVGGDAGYKMENSFGGDADSIHIAGIVSDHAYIGGDAGQFMNSNSIGGANDSITIEDTVSGDAAIGGDAGLEMRNSTGGDGDSITIGGSASDSFIGGDAGYNMKNSTGGSGDSIHIEGNVSGRTYIGGDVGQYMTNSTGGTNDSITIAGNVSGQAHIGGDAGYSMINSTGGSGDSIHIAGTVNGNVHIGGDAGYSMEKSSGGDDHIFVQNLADGIVSGDAYSMRNSTGGNDDIRVNTMQGGSIYGDGGIISSTFSGGNDTISVGELSGTGRKVIDGGAGGKDLFEYDNAEGHTLTLTNDGKVTIFDADGKDVTNATNTNITNFEGIGGGSGNDILDASGTSFGATLDGGEGNDKLFGGSGDDIIFGGEGNDILIGGAGANALYGGEGNSVMDGGEGTDYLTGLSKDLFANSVDGNLSLDSLLANADDIKNMELLVFNGNSTLTDIASMGNSNGELNADFINSWTNTGNTVTLGGNEYHVYQDGNSDMTVAILKSQIEGITGA